MQERDAFKLLCENSFSFYCKQFLKVVEPETKFEWNWHLDLYCDICEKIYSGELMNIDIQVPPRTLKSIIFNVLFPTWIWTKKPSFKIMSASSSYYLANKYNRQRRELITSDAYQFFWPITLKRDSNTIMMFSNTYNGFMRSVSAMGKVTGDGADLLISDDLIDAKDAFSKPKREGTCNWYENVFYGRAQNRKTVRRININQRLHQFDISELLKRVFKFPSLVIQMIKTAKELGTLTYNDPRKLGELLFPSRYGLEEAEQDKKNSFKWFSQFQQSPVSPDSGIIKEEWIRYYKRSDVHSFEMLIMTGDLNFKPSDTSDYAVFAVWGKKGEGKYLVDIIRGRWTYAKTKEIFIEFFKKHNKVTNVFIENKANGPALISDLKDKVSGLKEWPVNDPKLSKASKVERMHMVSQDFEVGNVHIPDDMEIMPEYLEELLSFTENGTSTGHDDMVDTTSMALIELKKKKSFIYAGNYERPW